MGPKRTPSNPSFFVRHGIRVDSSEHSNVLQITYFGTPTTRAGDSELTVEQEPGDIANSLKSTTMAIVAFKWNTGMFRRV
jgi:hypothetical protein